MTNKIVLRTVEEFMNDYKPVYVPILPLFMDNAIAYAVEAGKVNFSRLEAVGDLRSKMLGPKDTEFHQIGAAESKKGFKKYFFGSQFRQSSLQDARGYESVVAQVLDEHNKQADELMLNGEGTDAASAINNGLFWSQDPNYTLNASYEVLKASDGTHVADLYAKLSSAIKSAQQIDGRIVVFLYGATTKSKIISLFPATSRPLSAVLADAFQNVSFVEIPDALTVDGSGFIVVNMDQVQLHYTTLPKVDDQGVNAEKKYVWTNFLMGSSMLDVKAKGAITRQPLTYAA